jgi:hypothetical protein
VAIVTGLGVLAFSATCGAKKQQSGAASENSRPAVPRRSLAHNEEEVARLGAERILQSIEKDDVRLTPGAVCVGGAADVGRFEPAPAEVLKSLAKRDPRIISASECTTEPEQWGRVIRRSDSRPSILISAHAYVFEQDARAFVLGGWYVNTMRAQRFVILFRHINGKWHLDDSSKLGAV